MSNLVGNHEDWFFITRLNLYKGQNKVYHSKARFQYILNVVQGGLNEPRRASSTFFVNGDAYILPCRLHTYLGLNSNGSPY